MFLTDEYIQISRQIVQVAPAVRVFLLGTRTAKYSTQNIFTSEPHLGQSTEHYYLLVLVRRNREASNNCVQDRIETVCSSINPVTVFVIDFEQFNTWLQEGHHFAYQVTTKAKLLFEDLTISFGDVNEVDSDAIKESQKAVYCKGYNMMQEFLAGADLYRIRQQNKMAAFMLHQATESALHAILKISIGLCVSSHNLDKLIRYCSLAHSSVTGLFKRHMENENRLFQLLQRAYIETRYKETYCINTSDLIEITSKIRLLQEILVSFKC